MILLFPGNCLFSKWTTIIPHLSRKALGRGRKAPQISSVCSEPIVQAITGNSQGLLQPQSFMGGSVVVSRQITSHTPWLITVLCPISTYQSSKRKQNICTQWKEGPELNPECVSSFQQEICAGSSLLEHEIKPELTINTQKSCFSSCSILKHREELIQESQRGSSPKAY